MPKTTENGLMPERILDVAGRLFHRHGFKGFSYPEIAAELGVKHSAIHYHYPAKADLGVALIERFRSQVAAMSAGSDEVRTDCRKQLQLLFDYYRNHADLHDGALCPIGAMAIEAASAPTSIQMQMRLLIKDVLTFLTRVLSKGRDQDQFHFDGRADEKALFVLSALTGALQIARYAGPDYLDTTIHQIERTINQDE